jgi:hypothetical protein
MARRLVIFWAFWRTADADLSLRERPITLRPLTIA